MANSYDNEMRFEKCATIHFCIAYISGVIENRGAAGMLNLGNLNLYNEETGIGLSLIHI